MSSSRPIDYRTPLQGKDCRQFELESPANNPINHFLQDLYQAETSPPKNLDLLRQEYRVWFNRLYGEYLGTLQTREVEPWEWQTFKLFRSTDWLGAAAFLGFSLDDLKTLMNRVEQETGLHANPEKLPPAVIQILKKMGEWERVSKEVEWVSLLPTPPVTAFDEEEFSGMENRLFRRILVVTTEGKRALEPFEIASTIVHEAAHIEYFYQHWPREKDKVTGAGYELHAYRAQREALQRYQNFLQTHQQPTPFSLEAEIQKIKTTEQFLTWAQMHQGNAPFQFRKMRKEWLLVERLPIRLQEMEIFTPNTLHFYQDLLRGTKTVGATLFIDPTQQSPNRLMGLFTWEHEKPIPLEPQQFSSLLFLERAGRKLHNDWQQMESLQHPEDALQVISKLHLYDGNWEKGGAPNHYRIFMGSQEVGQLLEELEK